MLAKRTHQYKIGSNEPHHHQQQQQPSQYGGLQHHRQRIPVAASGIPPAPAALYHRSRQRKEQTVYWSPPTLNSTYQQPLSIAKQQHKDRQSTLVEHDVSPISSTNISSKASSRRYQHGGPRPKMGLSRPGIPVMTSTPSVSSAAAAVSSHPDPSRELIYGSTEEEPIYCEITKGDSPAKTPTNRSSRANPVQRRAGSRQSTTAESLINKRKAGDFSQLRINSEQTSSASSNGKRLSSRDVSPRSDAQSMPPPPVPLPNGTKAKVHQARPPSMVGLGRRAVTQFDFGPRSSTRYPGFPARTGALSQAPGQFRCSSRDLSSTSSAVGPYTSDSEFPMSLQQRRPHAYLQRGGGRVQQKAAASHGDYSSEYGFGLDDTTSTTATESVANQSTTSSMINSTTVRKGLLWQQRDKIFSRWKERFFILTQDYLQCFKKGTSRMTEMGGFIFKVRLAEVEEVELLDKKGYMTVCLSLAKDGKILLRKPEGIRDWFQSLKECVMKSKERHGIMKSTKDFWSKKQFTDSSSMEQWISARRRIESKYAYKETDTCVSADPVGIRQSSRSRQQLHLPVSTTDYGFIDMPTRVASPTPGMNAPASSSSGTEKPTLQRSRTDILSSLGMSSDENPCSPESRSSISPISSDFLSKKTSSSCKDNSSTFSHDSGVDSMNTNSSGSVLCASSSASSASSSSKVMPSSHLGRPGPAALSRQSRLPKPVQSPQRGLLHQQDKARHQKEAAARHISLV